jgi:hypothetical protein
MKYQSRARTADFDGGTAILTKEKIGATQSLTPEGYLLCENVPVARTGWMIYGPGETPISVGQDGVAHVERDAATLLCQTALASLIAKPLVDNHPDADVTPDNWNKLAAGIILNPRVGEGENSDCIVVDILVTSRSAIKAIQANKKEVSAGYDADYEPTGPGSGRQENIIFNHVALVDRGRCGPRCAIGDHATSTEKEPVMGNRVIVSKGPRTRRVQVADAVRRAFKDAENAAMEAMGIDPGADPDSMEDDDAGGDTHIHIHGGGSAGGGDDQVPSVDETPGAAGGGSVEDRLSAVEGAINEILTLLKGGQGGDPAPGQDEMPEGLKDELEDDDKSVKTGDSAALNTSYLTTLALAEVLVPGFRMPTFDAKAKRATTVDMMCSARRKALDTVYATGPGAELVNTVSGKGKDATIDIAGMACDKVAILFKAAAGAQSLLNNRATVGDGKLPREPEKLASSGPQSLMELNKFYDTYYANAAK